MLLKASLRCHKAALGSGLRRWLHSNNQNLGNPNILSVDHSNSIFDRLSTQSPHSSNRARSKFMLRMLLLGPSRVRGMFLTGLRWLPMRRGMLSQSWPLGQPTNTLVTSHHQGPGTGLDRNPGPGPGPPAAKTVTNGAAVTTTVAVTLIAARPGAQAVAQPPAAAVTVAAVGAAAGARAVTGLATLALSAITIATTVTGNAAGGAGVQTGAAAAAEATAGNAPVGLVIGVPSMCTLFRERGFTVMTGGIVNHIIFETTSSRVRLESCGSIHLTASRHAEGATVSRTRIGIPAARSTSPPATGLPLSVPTPLLAAST